ncbi:MAG TPA: peptidoglycan-binding domain-containing protein [Pseudolabrys sp.]|nr:peptidoglycan-binding domain-containing protein [Pseudolabrys sp.]
MDDEYEFEDSRLAAVVGLISRHPREFVGLLVMTAASTAILVNALFLQAGPHPAPLWAFKARPVADAAAVRAAPARATVQPAPSPAPAPAPQAAPARSRPEIIADIQRELAKRSFYDGAADGVWGAKTDAAIRDFAQAAGVKAPADVSEDLLRQIARSNLRARVADSAPHNDPIAELLAPSKSVQAVQRALSDFGYGQIKPTGVLGPETQAAIEKFERDRKLPVTGQISDRLLRELSAVTGRPLE